MELSVAKDQLLVFLLWEQKYLVWLAQAFLAVSVEGGTKTVFTLVEGSLSRSVFKELPQNTPWSPDLHADGCFVR